MAAHQDCYATIAAVVMAAVLFGNRPRSWSAAASRNLQTPADLRRCDRQRGSRWRCSCASAAGTEANSATFVDSRCRNSVVAASAGAEAVEVPGLDPAAAVVAAAVTNVEGRSDKEMTLVAAAHRKAKKGDRSRR